MREPLVTNEQAERWLMREHLAPEVHRVVTAVWHGVYSVPEAMRELRGVAYLISQRNRVAADLADAVAVNAFDDEMQRQETAHESTIKAMTDAGMVALRQGANLAAARSAVANVAREATLIPTAEMMTYALEQAALQHRRAEKWWASRETAE